VRKFVEIVQERRKRGETFNPQKEKDPKRTGRSLPTPIHSLLRNTVGRRRVKKPRQNKRWAGEENPRAFLGLWGSPRRN